MFCSCFFFFFCVVVYWLWFSLWKREGVALNLKALLLSRSLLIDIFSALEVSQKNMISHSGLSW